MENYSFWQDFFDTYQSLSDGMKALWLIVPPAFLLALAALVLRHRVDGRRADAARAGRLIYSIHRDEEDRLHILSHAPRFDDEPALLLLARRGEHLDAPQDRGPLPLALAGQDGLWAALRRVVRAAAPRSAGRGRGSRWRGSAARAPWRGYVGDRAPLDATRAPPAPPTCILSA